MTDLTTTEVLRGFWRHH